MLGREVMSGRELNLARLGAVQKGAFVVKTGTSSRVNSAINCYEKLVSSLRESDE